jgi:hypothetical protein
MCWIAAGLAVAFPVVSVAILVALARHEAVSM